MASVIKLKDLTNALVLCCAESEQSPGGVISDLEKFFGDIDGSGLKKALESPVIPATEKIEILNDICRMRGYSDIVRNFLVMTAEFGKSGSLLTRRREVLDTIRSAGGAMKATVSLARPAKDADREMIRQAVERLGGGAKSEVEFVEDSEIIGGIVVRVGNSLYDDSIKTHLGRMRAALSK